MKLPVRLALRYIVKRRSSTLVHLISGISVTVIAAVAAAMVCILSAFNGIEDLVKDLFGTLDADVALVRPKAVIPETGGGWRTFLGWFVGTSPGRRSGVRADEQCECPFGVNSTTASGPH